MLYAVVLAVVLFSPTSGTQSGLVHDITVLAAPHLPDGWATYTRFEVLANVALIVPLVALASLSFPHPTWTDWTSWGFLGSVLVECVQGLLLSQRQASFSDVVANTLGALLGSVLVTVVRKPERGRHARR